MDRLLMEIGFSCLFLIILFFPVFYYWASWSIEGVKENWRKYRRFLKYYQPGKDTVNLGEDLNKAA